MKPLAILALIFMILISCDDSTKNAEDGKSSYGASSTTTNLEFNITMLNQTKTTFTGKKIGTETIFEQEFVKYEAKSNSSTDEIYFKPYPVGNSSTITFGGLKTNTDIEITPHEPVTVELYPTINKETAYTGDFDVKLPGMSTKSTVTLSGTYKLVSDNDSVETSMGTVHGLNHYTGSGTVTGNDLPVYLKNIPLTAEVWYSPELGAAIKYRVPELGIGGDITGTLDFDTEVAEGYASVRKIGIINENNHSFELNTYEAFGKFDADKNTHAKMLLEIRYIDEEKAKTAAAPGYPSTNIEFGVPNGYFPSTLTESSVSIFHPEENGKGYKFFIGYVDQASKNSTINPVSYHIKVSADTDITPDMRVTARIYYKRMSETE